MNSKADTVEQIYSGKLASGYDRSMSHFFGKFKEKAFSNSRMKEGDVVLVFCCGTGLDFPHILRRIRSSGKIIGVDFSEAMLEQAEKKISKNNWKNVEIIQADVTKFQNQLNPAANTGVCTLGLSIIPDFKTAYHNLLSNVIDKGEIIIGDMQLASGWKARLNPVTISMAKRFGGSYEGHKNSLELQSMMAGNLIDMKKKDFFLGSYYVCIGTKQ